jgi:hypothetical protein
VKGLRGKKNPPKYRPSKTILFYAAQRERERWRERGIMPEKSTLTVLDTDTMLDNEHRADWGGMLQQIDYIHRN